MAETLDRPQNLLPPLQIIDYSSLDKPDNYRISPITPTLVENKKEDSVFEDWSGRGSHVDFTADETVPLVQGRFLGHGVNGGVWETHCKGVALAWKRKYCRRKIGDAERKEITILKKLSHNHIVKLVGTYTYRQFLGLLLWPVAVCDMATFFEDFETVLGENCTTDNEQSVRLTALGLPCESRASLHSYGGEFLYPKIGCLASAIAYLHEQKVRHKDLKPSNVLLSRDNLWVTDFGTSTDFSLLSTSATENGERGTPKYFAPEVAAFKPNGRSADIFSLGCIFLEMLTVAKYGRLKSMRMSRPAMDGSFQSNLNSRQQWLQMLNAESSHHKHLLCEIEDMLDIDPQKRPTAFELKNHLAFIDQFRLPHETTRIFGFCCTTSFLTTQEHANELESLRTSVHIKITSLQKQIDTLQAEARKMRDEQELHMQMCQSSSIRGEGVWGTSQKSNLLAEMYRPPFELMSQLPWDEARDEGKENEKWIIVNIQDPAIFDCQVLNRDIWKNSLIKETVKGNFIFMQYSKDDPRGNMYIQYHFRIRDSQDAYPHIAIVDPRTGEQVKVWSGPPVPKPMDFLMQLHEFLDRYSLKANARNPVATRKPERKKVDVNRMTEKEMMGMALRGSLGNNKGPRDDDPEALTKEPEVKGRVKWWVTRLKPQG